jgi:hypothetical protein
MSRHHGDARLESADPLLSRWQRRIGIGFTFQSALAGAARAVESATRHPERDDFDVQSFSLMLDEPAGGVVAAGWLHFNSPDEARIDYVAADRNWRGHGLWQPPSSILWKATPESARGGYLKS